MSSNENTYITMQEFEDFKRLTLEAITAVAQQGWANQQSIANLSEILEDITELETVNFEMLVKGDRILNDLRNKLNRLLPPGG